MGNFGGVSAYQSPRRRRRRGRYPQQYSVRAFVLAYLAAVFGCVVAAAVAPGLLLLAYPAAGVMLSRFIGRRVKWWNQADSIANVSKTKLHTILTWPVAVPIFTAQLFIAKFL